jgi:hypothetical protein
MFMLIRLFSTLFGVDRTVAILDRFGAPGLAWELLDFETLKLMKRDVMYCYKVDFGIEQVRKAKLALKANAYERAWMNATDALALLDWHGYQDDPTYKKAVYLRDDAASKIAPERLEDLSVTQFQAHKEFLSKDTHDFKKYVLRHHPKIARIAWRGIGRARIDERLP